MCPDSPTNYHVDSIDLEAVYVVLLAFDLGGQNMAPQPTSSVDRDSLGLAQQDWNPKVCADLCSF